MSQRREAGPKALYEEVSDRAKHRCEYCRAPEIIFSAPFEVDHIIPKSLGGKNILSNMALSCRACNAAKHNFTTGLDPVTRQPVALFNPRWQRWDDHFEVDLQRAWIVGKTSVGRATVNRLKLNSRRQVEARLRWLLLELFP